MRSTIEARGDDEAEHRSDCSINGMSDSFRRENPTNCFHLGLRPIRSYTTFTRYKIIIMCLETQTATGRSSRIIQIRLVSVART